MYYRKQVIKQTMKENKSFEIESTRPFAESNIWQLNRDYYQREGINAWQGDVVPHHMTSNSMVGKTYAEIILGLLRDLSSKNETTEIVYILELGSGHGRLAYHILKHIENLAEDLNIKLPPYCYVVSDIVEDSLSFYLEHPQYKKYFEQGVLDLCYFDATKSSELKLRYSNKTITEKSLNQPILAIANYFFDSIPTDLFYIKDHTISSCSVSLHSDENPKNIEQANLIDHVELTFHNQKIQAPFHKNEMSHQILKSYKDQLSDSYVFFPQGGFQCIDAIKNLSKQGTMIISMDKGFQSMTELQNKKVPEIITHGSFSIWVNYHAFGEYCQKSGGSFLFPDYSTFYSQVVCLMFLSDVESYKETVASYQNHVNSFGPDDFNGIKRLAYNNISKLNLKELIALIRLSYYDSTLFIKFLPRIKQSLKYITVPERTRLGETMDQVWEMYFTINNEFDLAYEIAGISYDLGYYRKALVYFQHSTNEFGEKADVFYNQALCHYQLREDFQFVKVKEAARKLFPDYAGMAHLDKLDLEQ